MARLVQVDLIVSIPDDVQDVEEYMNEVVVDATHPKDGDIYQELRDYTVLT